MERSQILGRLKEDLEKAQQWRDPASMQFHRLIADVPTGIPFPDNVARIKTASQDYTNAIRAVESALKAQNDFLFHGVLPPESAGEISRSRSCS
jgi:hypothetical protein